MDRKQNPVFFALVAFALNLFTVGTPLFTSVAGAQTSAPPNAGPSVRLMGSVRAISGSTLTIATDAGPEATVQLQPSATFVRTAPGRKDLQGATSIQLSDIVAGDRILVRGKFSDDGKLVLGLSAVVMKKEDIVSKQELERQDWQRRGTGGLVKAVDVSAGAITINSGFGETARSITVHVTSSTVLRRYASNSVKYDDAKTASLDQVKAGDQLRARGNKVPEGTEMTADEVVFGSFRNIAGTVETINTTENKVVVKDVLSKKTMTVGITPESQVHRLPEMVARGLAMRLHGPSGQSNGGQSRNPSGPTPPAGPSASSGENGNHLGNGPGHGGGDVQQMLTRLPKVDLAEIHKGDAVMAVVTEDASAPTAITMLTGVEGILSSSNSDSRGAALLSQWSLGSQMGESGP